MKWMKKKTALRTVMATAGVIAAGGVLAIAVAVITASRLAAQAAALGARPACSAGTVVQTADGPVCGVTANGVTSYLGLRFAPQPTRWAAPGSLTPWTAIFEATVEGNACPQPRAVANPSEDCLNLDVQVPANRGANLLPVMLEIHGGGFVVGTAVANGANLVTNGNVVYVTINYRLGILGFMAHQGLGPNSGDYGLQDQQAAMRWVQRNIAQFGGDPRNVTIFGQSAGGASVCAAVASPTANGLFQRGISQSAFYNYKVNTIWSPGDCKSQLPTESEAQQAGATFAVKVGCGGAVDQVACLRALPVQTLIDNAGYIGNPTAGGTIGPTINGTTLPMSPGKAFATGQINKVGLMIGVDRDEFNGGPIDPPFIAANPAQYDALVRQQFGPLAFNVMSLYPPSRFPKPSAFIAYRTIMADSASVCPALASFKRLAKYIPVHAWEGDNPDVPRVTTPWPTGSFHVAESPFMFVNPAIALDPNQMAFSAQLIAQWTGYARTGDPTAEGAPAWSRYTEQSEVVMSLVPAGNSTHVPASTLAMQHKCEFWDSVSLWPIPRE
jgi:para-nitrobenzyl esterase